MVRVTFKFPDRNRFPVEAKSLKVEREPAKLAVIRSDPLIFPLVDLCHAPSLIQA